MGLGVPTGVWLGAGLFLAVGFGTQVQRIMDLFPVSPSEDKDPVVPGGR